MTTHFYQTKTKYMKKLLAILAVAGVMTACNNGDSSTTATDSTKTDSSTMTTPMDTSSHMDTMNHTMDSGTNKMDTTKKK
ncbi:MAG: hypothetical protein JWN76_642 [Chitinophagaceae bacterium]|nr:hypothetical protein [Chitinophagaceae bacterium]